MQLVPPNAGDILDQPGNDVGVVTPEELIRWRAVADEQRAAAAQLGRGPEWEVAFRRHKRTLRPPEAARAALGDVLLLVEAA